MDAHARPRVHQVTFQDAVLVQYDSPSTRIWNRPARHAVRNMDPHERCSPQDGLRIRKIMILQCRYPSQSPFLGFSLQVNSPEYRWPLNGSPGVLRRSPFRCGLTPTRPIYQRTSHQNAFTARIPIPLSRDLMVERPRLRIAVGSRP